ncbi:aminomethyltransferase [Citromicrobium sp. RCC1885]|uniref:glycine cleavage system aminomethyltransferase GcvT n=1 Tax=unclassified Citromicrobium TaxID=2630544 RepID=UPI0006C907A8|nr:MULTISPECIES: glycine cleavage system aminomethyltransferase GcvT [unclassified Citromicrobium]KPM22179.1 aminomethyltransferase [Citromicrobium sp. RCC1885]KPM24205.1 aminomethyltransferase [Citromicrobium sp. RCC1878]OAM07490.1 glycine cleavage system protein T [Citromicrobium sp. RCC1897]
MSEEETETAPEKLALDAWHRAHGARMVPFAGYEMPIQYEGIVAEHDWTRAHAGLFDVSHMGQLTLEGPDGDIAAAAEALEALVPGLVSSLKPGRMRYTLLLAEDGGILDDLMVTNTGQHVALVVNGACKWDDIAFLREHLPDDITLTHHEDQALLALQGPEAVDALGELVPAAAELVFMTAGFYDWNGVPLWISRAGYTGEDGFEISVPADHAEKLAAALVEDKRVKPIGLGARDSLRLEAGLPLYGHDLTAEIDPVTAELTFALSKKRREAGGYHGHARISGALSDGAAQKRIGLVLDGRLPAREGSEIFAGDTQVGTVTSGGFSPTLGHPIAMGYVDAAHAEIDAALEVQVRNKRLPARVAKMPFVQHRYFRGS